MTLAPLLYRASPVEHLRSVSAPHPKNDLEKYSNYSSYESRGASPLPTPAVSATEISRPSSTSTQASNAAFVQQQHQYNKPNIYTLPQSTTFSLPGLSALASIASAPSSQLRYVADALYSRDSTTRICPPGRVLPVQARPKLTLVTNCQILLQSCDTQFELCELFPCYRLSFWQCSGKSVGEWLNTSWRQVFVLIGISLHQSYRISISL